MSTWTYFVKIWTDSNCELNANFLTFLDLNHLCFALETIGVSQIVIWLLIFEKNPFQFWREIWTQVLVISKYNCTKETNLTKRPVLGQMNNKKVVAAVFRKILR